MAMGQAANLTSCLTTAMMLDHFNSGERAMAGGLLGPLKINIAGGGTWPRNGLL
jgi:hypothetical protein